MKKQDITNMKVAETIYTQVSRKQDTYYLEIKEDLSVFYCFFLESRCFRSQKKQQTE